MKNCQLPPGISFVTSSPSRLHPPMTNELISILPTHPLSPLFCIIHRLFFFFFQSTRNDPSDTTLIAYICEIDLILIVTCHISRMNQQWTRAFLTSCYRIIRQKQDQHHNETSPPLEEPNQMVTKTRAEKKQNKKGGHAKKSGHSLLLTDLIIREKIKEAAKKE